MTTLRKIILGILVSSWAAPSANAQEPAGAQQPAPSSAVTISTSDKGLRFAALGAVKQIRLEVFGESGDSLYASGFQSGNVRDWNLRDRQGLPMPDGAYLCVVTFRDVSGRVGMRQGRVVVRGGRPSFQLEEGERVGAVEQEKAVGALSGDSAGALTLTAHDGTEGHVVSTRGGLSFGTGDFFAGKERELMRLTPEGNLGIGTRTPVATLDVAGTIRAARGLIFADGTLMTSASGRAQKLSADGTPEPLAGGTGTPNRLARWLDDAGTLTDSVIFEDASGNIGVGTNVPGGVLDLQRNSAGDILQRFWNTGAGGAKLRYVAATGATTQMQFTDGAEWLSSIAGNNQLGLQFRVRATNSVNSEAGLNQSAVLTLARSGNVGVGTATPAAKLDVSGNLRVSGNVVVDGNIAAKYQDVAEWVPAREQLAAGTVVTLDTTRTNAVKAAERAYDTHVAGVVSAQPGVILGQAGEGKVMVATTGRVKVRVDATRRPIRVGDLLVTSNKRGVAMRSVSLKVRGARLHRPGTIIGRALEPLAQGDGEILVLLSLQ
jgi:hypothetical protein